MSKILRRCLGWRSRVATNPRFSIMVGSLGATKLRLWNYSVRRIISHSEGVEALREYHRMRDEGS